jgi:hypothetical protein
MKKKRKLYYKRFHFYNRWVDKRYLRPSNWTYLGVLQRWASYDSMCYKICLFGLEFSFWFEEKEL